MFRSRRSSRYVVRPKRSSDRVIRSGQSAVTAGTQQAAYTYTATRPCTVRSIKLDIGATVWAANSTALPYVLVVVREGYDVNNINYPAITDDMYNPTMDVLISGVLTENSTEDHKWNAIGRKLKSGDRICLIVKGIENNSAVVFELSFSILT